LVAPFAQGVPAGDVGDGLLSGMKQYKFMRACFGMVVCSVIGVVVTLLTKPEPEAKQEGLVWGKVPEADAVMRGEKHPVGLAKPEKTTDDLLSEGDEPQPLVHVSRALAARLGIEAGDRVYVSDERWWLGGLYASHGVVDALSDHEQDVVVMGPNMYESVVAGGRAARAVTITKE
jgi:hypothetical protein